MIWLNNIAQFLPRDNLIDLVKESFASKRFSILKSIKVAGWLEVDFDLDWEFKPASEIEIIRCAHRWIVQEGEFMYDWEWDDIAMAGLLGEMIADELAEETEANKENEPLTIDEIPETPFDYFDEKKSLPANMSSSYTSHFRKYKFTNLKVDRLLGQVNETAVR